MVVQLDLGLDVIRSYRRLSYTPWHALAEFVDNSTQAYFNNREVLDERFKADGERLEVAVVYDRDQDFIRVSDNSIGMNQADLVRALKVGIPPANTKGRSQFGMGLKTAACWLGDCWTVRTKKLGETDEFMVSVDVERVASGDNQLPTTAKASQDPNRHYTIIEIRRLNRKFHGRTLGKIKKFLESMYRVDLRANQLELSWNGSPLRWEETEDRFVKAVDGSVYKKNIEFLVGDKSVRGWIGILDFGHGGRPHAGFSILRFGRVIKGFPESWRPESIFGQIEGSNDLINQRITGEIHLDDFEVSHTKDDIQWLGDEEYEVLQKLKEIAAPYVSVAKDRRRRDMRGQGGPSEIEIKTAIDELQAELTSSEMADLISLESVPPPTVVQQANTPLLASAESRIPSFSATGALNVDGYLVTDGSPNDPYVVVDSSSDSKVIVVVNMQHPYLEEISGSEGMLNYLRHCTYDAIAEWKARQQASTVDSGTITALKDSLLRIPLKIEMRQDPTQ